MLKTIDELLALVSEGDEDAQAEIRERFASAEREKAIVARDLKLKTDATLKERYPRALRAYEKGRLRLTDDMDEAAMLEALKDKEEELAELGVSVEPVAPAATPEGEDVPVKPVEDDDPAKALSGARGAGSPGGQPRDLVAEWADAMKGTTKHDRAKANAILVELNNFGQKNPERAQQMMDQINSYLEARPIPTRGM
jgi:hypothetical protein